MKLISVIGIFLALTTFLGKAMEPNNSIHEQLFDAVKSGNCALVEHLLNLKELSNGDLRVDVSDKKNHTLLYVAAKNGHLDLVQLLLDKGANRDGSEGDEFYDGCNIYAYDYRTPLHAAAKKGHLAIVELLLAKGAQVNSCLYDDLILPVHLAAKNEHSAVVKLLIEHGTDIDSRTVSGYSCLALAAETGNNLLVRLLLSKGASVNDADGNTYVAPLYVAAQKGHLALVELLLAEGADVTECVYPHKSNLTALYGAAENGHLPVIKLLLAQGADINAGLNEDTCPAKVSALHLAAQNGHTEVAQYLLANGSSVTAQNSKEKTPLHIAFENNHIPIIDLLINHASGHDWTHIHGAAVNGDARLINFLLANGADINAKDADNKTPLHKVAHLGKCAVIQLLLDKGALVDAKTVDNYTPLHLAMCTKYSVVRNNCRFVKKTVKMPVAAQQERLEVIKLLLAQGADVNAQSNKNETPLYLLAKKGTLYLYEYYAQVIELLLSKGAHSNVPADNGMTLLHWAAKNIQPSLIKVLIDKGFDVNAQTDQGYTPCYFAAQYNCTLGQDSSVQTLALEILLHHGNPAHQDFSDSFFKSCDYFKRAQDNKLKLSQATEFKEIAQLLSTGAYAYPIIKAQVDKKRQELWNAIKKNDVKSVVELLKEGFTLSTCDKESNTLLHKAIESKSLQVINLLLSLGAHKYIDRVNKKGFTPMQLLVSKGLLARALSPRANADQPDYEAGLKRKR
ncbi:ankyrin repeat domain-containing protein [Candidatus Dependentiae bacterium]|nr:ankyrin repeat domain-containing protein [Candidatus Dependentiae bacterium]